MCDGLVNLPRDSTPLYSIRYITHKRYPIYATFEESLVVLVNSSTSYLAKSSQLQDIIGLWSTEKRSPSGRDPLRRINTISLIWDEGYQVDSEPYTTLKQFEVHGLESLYYGIVTLCIPQSMPSTFLAYSLGDRIPRPLAPEPGIALGTPLGSNQDADAADTESVSERVHGNREAVNERANPKSRRGGRLRRGRGK